MGEGDEWVEWGEWGDWGDWGECKLSFWRSKPFSQGIPRAIFLTIKVNIAGWDFKGPNPFSQGITRVISLINKTNIARLDFEGPNHVLKAFLGSFLLQLGPIVIEVDKVYGVHGVHGVIEVN